MLTHFQRVMVAAQVYAGGAVSERQAVEIARKLEALARDEAPRRVSSMGSDRERLALPPSFYSEDV